MNRNLKFMESSAIVLIQIGLVSATAFEVSAAEGRILKLTHKQCRAEWGTTAN
jgi:hypothetical protein